MALLETLREHRQPVTAERLAGCFEVSPRTIYRDVASLQALGAPIRGEAGVGYQLDPGYFLPPLRFDRDELDAVMLGLRLVAARSDGDLGAAAARAKTKIAAVLTGGGRDEFLNLPIRATAVRTPEVISASRHLSDLRAAIRGRAFILVRYSDAQHQASARTVRPLGLTLFDKSWLLTAWCEIRDDFRNFRLDRIAGLERTGRTFRPEPGKRFEDYLAQLAAPDARPAT